MSVNETTVYARVEGKKIIEFPVLGLHIQNRHHPLEWYKECYYDEAPIIPEFYQAREVPSVMYNGDVVVRYIVEPLPLSYLLSKLQEPVFNEETLESSYVVKEIADIEPALVERIVELIDEYATNKLNVFAQTRGYDGYESAIKYIPLSNATYAAEGQRVADLALLLWADLNAYKNEVLAGTTPLPTTISDIDAVMPTLDWGSL